MSGTPILINPDEPPAHLYKDVSLTKRERFAMAAMQGMCANTAIIGHNDRCGWDYVNCTAEGVAQAAIAQADALLSELAKGER